MKGGGHTAFHHTSQPTVQRVAGPSGLTLYTAGNRTMQKATSM